MSNVSFSAERLQQIKGFSAINETFKLEIDKLVETEISKAKTMIAQLSKLSLDGKTEAPVEAPKKKRGRPLGSVTINKSGKPRAKKVKPIVAEPTTEATVERLTHASAIKSVLTKEGLTAGQIWQALSDLKIEGYNAPSKATLYTSLSTMHSKKLIKSQGERPNVTYIAG
jgi:hypothetical protein